VASLQRFSHFDWLRYDLPCSQGVSSSSEADRKEGPMHRREPLIVREKGPPPFRRAASLIALRDLFIFDKDSTGS